MTEVVFFGLVGLLLGMGLQTAGMSRRENIRGMLALRKRGMLKTLLFALGIGTLMTAFLCWLAVIDVDNLVVRPLNGGVLVGAALVGLPFGLIGRCPGTALSGIGGGRALESLCTVLGGVVGAVCFALVYPWLTPVYGLIPETTSSLFRMTLDQPYVLSGGFLGQACVGALLMVLAVCVRPERAAVGESASSEEHGEVDASLSSEEHNTADTSLLSDEHGTLDTSLLSEEHGTADTSLLSDEHGEVDASLLSEEHGTADTSPLSEEHGTADTSLLSEEHGEVDTSRLSEEHGTADTSPLSEEHGTADTSPLSEEHSGVDTSASSEEHGTMDTSLLSDEHGEVDTSLLSEEHSTLDTSLLSEEPSSAPSSVAEDTFVALLPGEEPLVVDTQAEDADHASSEEPSTAPPEPSDESGADAPPAEEPGEDGDTDADTALPEETPTDIAGMLQPLPPGQAIALPTDARVIPRKKKKKKSRRD